MSGARTSSGMQAFKNISVRDAGNMLRSIKNAFARDAGNASRQIFSAFGGSTGVIVSPASVRGYGNSNSSIAISTASTAVTVTGGASPYTYAWTQLTGFGTWAATNPTGAYSSFRRGGVPQGGTEFISTWKCTVTDANGLSADSPVVTATVQNLFGA